MIRKILNKLYFSFVFSLKSIIKNKIQSFVLFIIFLAISVVAVLGLSNRWIMQKYFENEHIVNFQDVDYIMSINQNSDSRYFSIRYLDENQGELAENYASFSENDVLFSKNIEGNKDYVHSFSSNVYNLNKISENIPIINSFSNQEVIITNSFSRNYDFLVNDSIFIYVGDEVKEFVISYIVEDNGVFSDNSIFLNKEGVIDLFLSSLGVNTSIIPMESFLNIYNKTYFLIDDNEKIDAAMNYVKNIEHYSNLEFSLTYDSNFTKQRIEQTSIIIILLLIIFFLFLIRHNKNMIVFDTLGASDGYVKLIIFSEIFIILIFSLFANYFISNYFISVAWKIIDVENNFKIPINYFFITYLSILIILIFVVNIYYLFQVTRNNNKTNSNKAHFPSIKKIQVIAFLILLISSVILYIFKNNYLSMILTILSIYLIYFYINIISVVFIFLIKKISNNKIISNLIIYFRNKSFYYYLYMMSMIFLMILLLNSTGSHFQRTINRIEKEVKFDIVLNNSNDEVYDELNQYEYISSYTKANYINNIVFEEQNYKIENFVSVENNDVQEYFDFDIEKEELESDDLLIFLPISFNKVFNFQQGDMIEANLGNFLGNTEFKIGGFFESGYGNYAFSNLNEKINLEYNSILIDVVENKTNFIFNVLVEEYGKNFVGIIKIQDVISAKIYESSLVMEYIYYLIFIMFVCLLFSLVGYLQILFYSMSDYYNKMILLGNSKKDIFKTLILEKIISFLITITISIIAYFVISSQIEGLLVIIGRYMNFDPGNIIFNSFIYSICFLLIANLFYFLSLIKQKEKIVKQY